MGEVVDIAEEAKKHEDEWLLFEVTETTADDLPVKGRLLACANSRAGMHEEVMKYPGLDLQTIYTGDPVPRDTIPIL